MAIKYKVLKRKQNMINWDPTGRQGLILDHPPDGKVSM